MADRLAAAANALAAPRSSREDEWLDSRHAAEYLGIHRDTLRKLAAERAIPTEQDGPDCKLYFRRSDLDAWRRSGGEAAPSDDNLAAARLGGRRHEREASTTPRRVRVERNIYRRAIGVYEVGFKDAAGKQRWRTVDGGDHRRSRGTRRAPCSRVPAASASRTMAALRFGDAADRWLERPGGRSASATQACYRNAVEQHLLQRLGARRLDAITPDDLAGLVRELRARGLAESTIVIVIGVTNRIYRYAARRLGWAGVNPVSLMLPSERPKPSQGKRRRMFEGRELEETICAADRAIPHAVHRRCAHRRTPLRAARADLGERPDRRSSMTPRSSSLPGRPPRQPSADQDRWFGADGPDPASARADPRRP